MERERVFACVIDGRRHDCGSRLGYLEAQVAFARKRPDLWSALQRSLDQSPLPKARARERTSIGILQDAASAPRAFDASA